MRATFLILAVAALWAGCSPPHERAGCGVSTDCPAGEYCARTSDGNVCWPDAVPPVVSGVTVSCATPCLRDSVLQVQATISDDAEILDAHVTLDVGGPAVPLVRSGAVWKANVDLGALPFDAFDADVVITVIAIDGARNVTQERAAPINVTRLRWTYDAGAPMSSPAVMQDGTAVVGLSKTSLQVLAVNSDGTKRWEATAGTGFVSAAPAIGERAIWVGSEDFNVYALQLDGSGLLANVGVNTFGQIKGGVGLLSGASKEWAFAASGSGYVGVASSTANEHNITGPVAKFTTPPVVAVDGRLHAATEAISATVRTYAFDQVATALSERSSAQVGMYVSAPVALDAGGSIWSGSQDARVFKTVALDATAVSTTVATFVNGVSDSPIVLENGDLVVGDQGGVLHRIGSSGLPAWGSEPSLGGSIQAPMAMAGGSARFVVPTNSGKVFAVRDDGSIAWSKELGATVLRAGNIYTPNPTASFSTAYFSGSNGKLYAVIVDGKLDTAAPWPKAFHDTRNTNRAGAPLP
jgi:hypothetical protein